METMQYVLAIGRSDITDVLTNTVGGLLGLAVYSMVVRLIGNREKANRMFSVLAGIVSVAVIGTTWLYPVCQSVGGAVLSNKEIVTEKLTSGFNNHLEAFQSVHQ